jgi:hypothetical protein
MVVMSPPMIRRSTRPICVIARGDSRGVSFGDVGVFGVSAAPRSPLNTPYELSDKELMRRTANGSRP